MCTSPQESNYHSSGCGGSREKTIQISSYQEVLQNTQSKSAAPLFKPSASFSEAFSFVKGSDSAGAGGDVWINENRFRLVKQLAPRKHRRIFPSLFLVKEILTNSSSADTSVVKKIKDQTNVSDDGSYVMKKVLIHNKDELDTVKEEIRISSLFSHPNLLPLLDHSIIEVKAAKEISWTHESYLLFPVPVSRTLIEKSKTIERKWRVLFHIRRVTNVSLAVCRAQPHAQF